jgi:hypothetical protein
MKFSKTLLTGTLVVTVLAGITGCAPANIQSQLRGSSDNSNMMTRCVEVDARSNSELEEVMAKYDGWRLIYVSEYTTGNKIGTSASVCFEKPVK